MRRRKHPRDVEVLGMVLGRNRAFASQLEGVSAPIRPRDWERAVGTRIAARTKPFKLTRGVLIVLVSSPVWSNELSLLSEPICAQLRTLGIEVSAIRFRVGSIEAASSLTPRRPAKLVPRPAPLDPAIRRSLERVEDDALREAIEHAAQVSLAFSGRDPQRSG